jgi:hypothetical protein
MAIKCEYQCTILTETVDAPTGGHDVPQGLQYDIRRIRQLHKSSMQDVPQVGNVDVDYPNETVEMLDIGGTISAKKDFLSDPLPYALQGISPRELWTNMKSLACVISKSTSKSLKMRFNPYSFQNMECQKIWYQLQGQILGTLKLT